MTEKKSFAVSTEAHASMVEIKKQLKASSIDEVILLLAEEVNIENLAKKVQQNRKKEMLAKENAKISKLRNQLAEMLIDCGVGDKDAKAKAKAKHPTMKMAELEIS